MKPVLTCLILGAALALSACSKGEQKQAGAGKAEGEILPGSISDAQLPLDTVKSQAPLAPKSEGGEAANDKPAAKAKQGAPAKADAPVAEDAPAEAEPAPEQ